MHRFLIFFLSLAALAVPTTPFTGTLSFAQPYSNDQGIFALSGNNLIINPSGPGLSAAPNSTQNVTIVATQ
jgi:hypothetical protein